MKIFRIIAIALVLILILAGCSGQSNSTAAGTLPVVQTLPAETETPGSSAEAGSTAGKTTAAEPVTEQVTTEDPATEGPATEELTAGKPTTEEPVTAEPTIEEPVTKEPTTEEPVTEEPATEEPATEEPATPEWTTPVWTEPETTPEPTTPEPTTPEPTTPEQTTPEPTTPEPTTPEPTPPPPATTTPPAGSAPLVCIDPGHQAHANEEQEPMAPGSSETKAKVADGTHGVTTGIRESVVNLTIALQLRDELEARGYRVLMTRTSEDVDISNIERAQIANNAGADAFLRLHCDYGDWSSSGISVFCQHPYSEYNGFQYENSRRLSETVLAHMCRVTGAPNLGVTEAYHYSGINWAKVPGGLIEMGFMSNPAEEQRLLDPAYQQLLVQGMADGLDAYFGR
ncbi:MAG: N-acetylmuramoyl-L-alanine amidase [Lachnospiraceae bacterium]|nr:N-acetylmuramoyl-L-alanine amidase [Lachnospiraceae bacterium]